MAADKDPKLTKRQADNVRANIANSASNIATRLQKHAMGQVDMTPSQVKAAQILLDRVVPSMQSIEATTRTEEPAWTPEQVQAALREWANREALPPPVATIELAQDRTH